jgi:hypothetical protein
MQILNTFKRNLAKTVSGLFFISAICVTTGCGNSSEDAFLEDFSETTLEDSGPEISEEVINDLIQSIPSPVEMASLIKSAGGAFNSQLINKTENTQRFSNNNEQSINMGIYVADLGYVNIYEKTMYSIDYLNAIRSLAEEIKVGHFFDFETLKRLSANSQNIDSILFISTSNFNKMDAFLRQQKRAELGVLIVTGAWIEGLYITTQIAKASPNPELYDRIGDQKFNMDNLYLILNAYRDKPFFASLTEQIKPLKEVYDQIKITYEYAEPEAKEVNGKLVIIDNSKNIIHITDDHVAQITERVEGIRNEIVKNRMIN